MKILFITGSLNQGGAEYQMLELVKLFQDRGHEVQLFAITDYDHYKPFILKYKIPYTHLFNHQSKLKRIWLTSRKIKNFQPDLIFSYLKVVGKVTVIAKLLSGVKCKVIVGERTADIQPLKDKFHFNLMRVANAITVNSMSKLEYLQENFEGIKKKSYFFPNILDISQIPLLEKSYKLNFLHLGFIGRISSEKNIIQMIQAVAMLNLKNIPVHFSIYGDARSPSYLEEVKALIRTEELKETVILMGKTNDILEVYRQIDLLILISDYEGFSNVISEALCSGLPIITSDIPENKYLVENHKNGFIVNHKEPESIASGIEKYMNLSVSEKRKMSLENRKKTEAIFDRELLYKNYMDLIKTL